MECLDIKMVCSIHGKVAGSLLERGTAFTSTHTMVAFITPQQLNLAEVNL